MYHKSQQALFRSLYSSKDNNIEEVLNQLRILGASQVQCIKLLTDELSLSLTEADNIVLNSKAWQADKKATERFRDEFGNFLDT